MKDELFVVSDIHGCANEFELLLKHWNRDNQRLTILGDAIDRGKDSKAVLERIVKEDALFIKGNHEDVFLKLLDEPNRGTLQMFFNLGGMDTLRSFFGTLGSPYDSQLLATRFKTEYPEIYQTIQSSLLYFEWGNYFLVHAGIDPQYTNGLDSDPEDFLWIREEFIFSPHLIPKVIIHGHTPIFTLYPFEVNTPTVSKSRDKINIDGGCVFGHYLHALVVKDGMPLQVYTVSANGLVEFESTIDDLHFRSH